jgi:hypothetical protein
MSSQTTTFIAQADNADGFVTRASSSTSYSHALIVGKPGDRGAVSWHKTEAAARKAASAAQGRWTKPEVVEVTSRNGSKVTVERALRMERESNDRVKAKAAPIKAAKAAEKKATAPKAPKAPKADAAELEAANPGYRTHTKSRSTKTVAVLIDGTAGHPLALDAAKGKWQTICLDHKVTAAHAGQRPARDVLGHPEVWCKKCKAAQA